MLVLNFYIKEEKKTRSCKLIKTLSLYRRSIFILSFTFFPHY